VRDKLKEVWDEEGVRGIFKLVGGMLGQYENEAVAARYQALEKYPAGSLGEPIRDNAAKTSLRSREKKAAVLNSSCFTMAHMSWQDTERIPKERARSPASAQAFGVVTRGSSSSLSYCSFISVCA